jgi:hypothetical protein
MNAQQIFELALQYGAEQPGITFDSEALLRYTRKVQEMERERIIAQNAPEIEKINAHIKALEEAAAIRARSNP